VGRVPLELRFSDVRVENGPVRSVDELELKVGADFELLVGERVIYREVEFTVVELRFVLDRWMRESGPDSAVNFVFVSVESDERGLVWFKRQPGGYRVGSVHQEFESSEVFTLDEARLAARRFIEDVDRWVLDELGVDLASTVRR
jgi:hypothetical protein